jgi:hypothetical protein
MSDMSFGITVTIVGMGGTLFTLWVLSVATLLLKKICPVPKPPAQQTKS